MPDETAPESVQDLMSQVRALTYQVEREHFLMAMCGGDRPEALRKALAAAVTALSAVTPLAQAASARLIEDSTALSQAARRRAAVTPLDVTGPGPHPAVGCCSMHSPAGCCDPEDCGPCCRYCPTVRRMRDGDDLLAGSPWWGPDTDGGAP